MLQTATVHIYSTEGIGTQPAVIDFEQSTRATKRKYKAIMKKYADIYKVVIVGDFEPNLNFTNLAITEDPKALEAWYDKARKANKYVEVSYETKNS